MKIALQHDDTWSEYSTGSFVLAKGISLVYTNTTFPSGTFIKTINVFSNFELMGFNFTGSNGDTQCIGDCRASYLQKKIAPGGVLNYIDAEISVEVYEGSYFLYNFSNIAFKFVCAWNFFVRLI